MSQSTRSTIEALEPATSSLTLSLDVGLYPRDVLYAAAYVFLDRAYVLLDRVESRFVVHVRGKRPLDAATLQAMAGEFENELLAQALRLRVADANQRIIEGVVAVAIAGAAGDPDGTDGTALAGAPLMDPADPEDGFVSDPNGIGKPFEPEKQ
jgi:His-Xaa-Ser system protein HxsD